MRLPGDVSGDELTTLLRRLGYQITPQTGSHLRLVRTAEEEHRITIPRHGSLRVGTLNGILKDIAIHLRISKAELMQELRG